MCCAVVCLLAFGFASWLWMTVHFRLHPVFCSFAGPLHLEHLWDLVSQCAWHRNQKRTSIIRPSQMIGRTKSTQLTSNLKPSTNKHPEIWESPTFSDVFVLLKSKIPVFTESNGGARRALICPCHGDQRAARAPGSRERRTLLWKMTKIIWC